MDACFHCFKTETQLSKQFKFALAVHQKALMHPLLAPLFLLLPLRLAAAAEAAPMTSPSGKIHLRFCDSISVPYEATPAGKDLRMQVLRLEEKYRSSFFITAPEGRCSAHWSDDEKYLALAIQMDRANFSLVILRMSDRKSILCDFTPVNQQWTKLLKNAALAEKEKLAAAIGPSQLRDVRCTPQLCTGAVISGTAQHTATFSFTIDFSKLEWNAQSTLIQPQVIAATTMPGL